MPKAKSKQGVKKTMPTSKKPAARSRRQPVKGSGNSGFLKNNVKLSSRNLLVLACIFGLVGAIYLAASFANPGSSNRVIPFKEDRARGLIWEGLEARTTGPCANQKALAVVDARGIENGCTHGPDPAPEGIDATKSVEPLATGDTEQVAAATSGVVCEGDGASGKRVQLIYARSSDKASRYAQFAASFQQYATSMNNIFVESGNQTGSPRSIRFVTNPDCSVNVPEVVLTPTGDDSIGNTRSELANQGYNRSDRKYIVLTDATVYCGIGYVTRDTRPTADNASNNGPTYGRVDSGCWGGSVEVHELVHTIGGVQLDTPNSNTGWHCVDEYDRLCYNDGSGLPMKYVCASSEETRLDCNKDDYFNTSSNIPSTSYLATHWNLANSAFLIIGTPMPTTPPPTPTTDTTLPVVKISSPQDGSVVSGRVSITANATDNTGVTKIEVYIDGALKTSTTSSSVASTWNTRKASRGIHSITVKAYDAAGNIGQTTIYVTK